MQPNQARELPEPDIDSAAHSELVARHLRERIGAGAISFAEFMHEALYAPGLGYYAAGSAKFGAAGDFVTAPEISPLFARVLARQCAAVMPGIPAASILELGAGSGRLAADLLARLAELDALPHSYQILEVSADLRERQRACIADAVPELLARVVWLDQLPASHSGIIVANEVLDALPVERFVRRAEQVAQVAVAVDGEKFLLVERPATPALQAAIAEIESELGHALPPDYASEVCLAAPAWIADIAAILRAGMILFFDYGVSRRDYYADDRSGGWLRCHFRHHAHDDPLLLPGIQDITAWVDFSAVAAAAVANDLDILGFVTQAHFLLNGGLDAELADFQELPPAAQLQISRQIKLLTLPGEMGENFKCMGLGRGAIVTPDSLTTSDRTHSL
jgi:SAM-dependent MidA family methyltransferase